MQSPCSSYSQEKLFRAFCYASTPLLTSHTLVMTSGNRMLEHSLYYPWKQWWNWKWSPLWTGVSCGWITSKLVPNFLWEFRVWEQRCLRLYALPTYTAVQHIICMSKKQLWSFGSKKNKRISRILLDFTCTFSKRYYIVFWKSQK